MNKYMQNETTPIDSQAIIMISNIANFFMMNNNFLFTPSLA
jgi:hypothetical protein